MNAVFCFLDLEATYVLPTSALDGIDSAGNPEFHDDTKILSYVVNL